MRPIPCTQGSKEKKTFKFSCVYYSESINSFKQVIFDAEDDEECNRIFFCGKQIHYTYGIGRNEILSVLDKGCSAHIFGYPENLGVMLKKLAENYKIVYQSYMSDVIEYQRIEKLAIQAKKDLGLVEIEEKK